MTGHLQAILLGLLQGLTEFLPVSSSGHLVIVSHLTGLTEEAVLPITVSLHLATTLAVIVWLRRELMALARGLFAPQPSVHTGPRRLLALLLVATIPTGIIGLLFKHRFELLFSSLRGVAVGLIITGILLALSDRVRGSGRPLAAFPFWKACCIGLAQGAAITPGISRSGATITSAVFLGLERGEAFTFSFLLSIPAVLGAGLLEGRKLGGLTPRDILLMSEGMAVAFGSGLIALEILSRFLKTRRLTIFAVYCWIVAAWLLLAN